MRTIQQDVLLEIAELRKLGIKISTRVDTYVKQNPQDIQAYYNNGMSVSEIADHVQYLV